MQNTMETDSQQQEAIDADLQQEQPQETESPIRAIIDEMGHFSPDWFNQYESLGEESKSLVKFKTPEALAKSYAQLEKMKQYPGIDQPEKMTAFRRLVGLPDEQSDYSINKPEHIDDSVWNQDFASQISQVAYEYGVPPQAMDAMANLYAEAQANAISDMEAHQQEQMHQAEQTLQNEWGSQYENVMRQVFTTVQKLAHQANVDADEVMNDPAIASNPNFIRIMKEVSRLTDESSLKGSNAAHTSGKDEAKRIESDPAHPLHEAYMNHSHPNHKYANKVYDQLAFS